MAKKRYVNMIQKVLTNGNRPMTTESIVSAMREQGYRMIPTKRQAGNLLAKNPKTFVAVTVSRAEGNTWMINPELGESLD